MSERLLRAREEIASGSHKRALATLWEAEVEARRASGGVGDVLAVVRELAAVSDGRVQREAQELEQHLSRRLASTTNRGAAYDGAIATVVHCTYLGGAGYPLAVRSAYDLVFTADGLRVIGDCYEIATAEEYEAIRSIDVSGTTSTTGGGFIGGGFGLGSAVEGMAIAAVLNSLTTRTEVNSVLAIQTASGELFFHASVATDALRMHLSPVFTRLRERERMTPPSPGDVVDQLARLADLLDRGTISPEEFAKLKGDLLGRG